MVTREQVEDTGMKELMSFVEDVATGLYYMGQTEIAGSFPVDGKVVTVNISINVEENHESH